MERDTLSAGQGRRSADGRPGELTVGHTEADVVGNTNRPIQIAIDALAARGGGIVRLAAGTYTCYDAVRLRPGICLIGEPGRTILRRGPGVWCRLASDAATSQRVIFPTEPSRFAPGMGVCLHDDLLGWVHTWNPLTVVDIENGALHLNDYLESDRRAEEGGNAFVFNYFPLLLGILADGAGVEGLDIEAEAEAPPDVQMPRTAAVYFWRSRNVRVRRLRVHGNPGDGICLAKSSEDGVIEDCEVSHCGAEGIHPGSYSERAIVRRCRIHDNAFDGLYICWGIRSGEFTDNEIYRNGWTGFRSGISIGHQDTDCLIARNHLHENARYGLVFRRKTPANGAHRAVVRENLIENNGGRIEDFRRAGCTLPEDELIGAGICVYGVTRDLVVERNIIRETREGEARLQRHAILLHPGVENEMIRDNTLSGHPGEPILDRRGA